MAVSTIELDTIDRTILELLQRDGRMTNAALADVVGLTAPPMLQRVRKLEEAGVIQRYTAVVDPSKIGRPILAFVHITLKDHGLQNHKKLVGIVGRLPHVLECHHIAGEEDILLKVSLKGIGEPEHLLLEEISASGLVGRIKTTLVLSSYKSNAPIPVSTEEEA